MRRLTPVVAAALTLAACSDGSGPTGRPETDLSFVRQDTLAPPLLVLRDSFYAKVGDGRELRLNYESLSDPGQPGEEFLRFEVPGDGLQRKPDGSPFRAGDSVLITVTVVDSVRFLFLFEPAGLRFNPEHPARLKVRYLNANKDFDDDGGPDPDDDDIEMLLDLWRQPVAGGLWFKLGAVKFEELDEIDANIYGFSRFAVAW
ncbi:MAG: hypothetical protein ACREMJ_09125 [Gemmatimonadales bacterium]